MALAGLSLGLLGCPDTEGEFLAYNDRYQALYGEDGSGGSTVCSAADIPTPGDIDGEFLFALSAKLSPTQPVLMHLNMTTADDGAGGLQLSWVMQPLNATDRTTLVGTETSHGPYAVDPADGTFEADLGELRIPGDGNPFSDNELVAEAALLGSVCLPGDFICGEASGTVTAPITYPLEGSDFTFERLPGAGQYPDPPKINCDGLPAAPP